MSGGVEVCNPIKTQKHYMQYVIQPMEFIGLNNLGYIEGNIIKYVCRYKLKNGLEDLKKAAHYLEKLMELTESGTISLGGNDDKGRNKPVRCPVGKVS